MRKAHTIILNNSRLRKVRSNLRLLIAHACWDEMESLRALLDGIAINSIESSLIYSQILDIEEALRKSICMCGTCRDLENDMIYFPSLKEWHCVKCDSKKLIWYPKPKS